MIPDSEALETCKKIEGEMKRAFGGKSPLGIRASRRSPEHISYVAFVDSDSKKTITFTHDFYQRKTKTKEFWKWLKGQVETTREQTAKGNLVIPDEDAITVD